MPQASKLFLKRGIRSAPLEWHHWDQAEREGASCALLPINTVKCAEIEMSICHARTFIIRLHFTAQCVLVGKSVRSEVTGDIYSQTVPPVAHSVRPQEASWSKWTLDTCGLWVANSSVVLKVVQSILQNLPKHQIAIRIPKKPEVCCSTVVFFVFFFFIPPCSFQKSRKGFTAIKINVGTFSDPKMQHADLKYKCYGSLS